MAKVAPLKENFNAGEFGARMHARVQFDKYSNAGAIYQNVLPLPQGGFAFRPGFRYIAGCASNSIKSRLLRFVYSSTQAYMLEFGDNILRFFKDQAQISTPTTDGSITNGAFATDITGWTDQSAGTGAISWDSTNLDLNLDGAGSGNEAVAEQAVTITTTNVLHTLRFRVRGDADDKAYIRVGSTSGAEDFLAVVDREEGWHCISFTPTSSPFYIQFENIANKTVSIDDVSLNSNAPVEITTPWSEADLPNLSYAQSADVMYFALGNATRIYRLERYGHQSWSIEQVLFNDGPYLDLNTEATTLTLSAVSGNGITVTASVITGINDDAGFQTTDVGRLIRWKDAANNWTWLLITGYTSTTVVTADVKGPDASATTATANWRLGEWSDALGWPEVVGFVQQRLGFANSTTFPQTFWLSKSADIENFADEDVTGTVQDNSSIDYTFAALQVNTVRWLASRKKAMIGTQGGEWTLRSQGAVLTPTDIAADFEVSGGVKKLQPLEVRNRLLFVQAQGGKLMEIADVLQESGIQGYDSFDLTLLNDRVLSSGADQLDYQQEPDSTIWLARGDGQAPTITYQPEQNVIGWARQIHGGTYLGEDAVIESVACIPGQDGSGQFKSSAARFEVWITVKMEINGSTVRYVECLEKLYDGEIDLQEDAFCVDSGLTLDSPITITGITQADPGVVIAAAHGLADGDEYRIVRVKGMIELNEQSGIVANKTAGTFELQDEDGNNIDTTGYTAYAANGEVREKVTAISGLDHLEGQTVQIFADGAVQVDKTVAAGAITLDNSASVVHVGLGYERRWKSLKLAYSVDTGTAVGKPKNIADVILVLMEAGEGSLTIATEDEDGEGAFTPLDLRPAGAIDGDPVPFFTGEKSLGVAAAYDTDLRMVIVGNAPVPATILALIPELEVAP